jgi:transcriptional regulator with XRE-family HTH domain
MFSENLKQLRADKKLSQADFAKKIGVHVTHLSRYERGLSSPSLEVVQKIVEVLNISIDTLVFGQENIEDGINDKELASLFKKTQSLSDKQKQTVKDLISAFVFQKDIQKQLA